MSELNEFETFKAVVLNVQDDVFGQINEILAESEEDAVKFYEKGNKSAGTRLRSSMQKIRKLIHHPTIRQSMNKVNLGAQEVRINVNDSK